MAATGKTPILLYGSTTATNTPVAGNLTNSSDGCEIAINVADKNLFFKDSTNTVNTVPIRQSSASSNGWLSLTDWSTFNSKQPAGSYALTTGTLAQFASTTSAQLAGVISDETGSGSLVFGTSPTFSGDVTVNTGNLVIGTSGKGIDFSATAGTGTSELLADYEEGTWTPNQGTGLTVVGSFSSSGVYTKIGRQVTVQGVVAGSTSVAIASTASFICTNLPFSASPAYSGSMFNASVAGFGGVAASLTFLYASSAMAATASITFSVTYSV